jgi:FAD-dependent urate hydroxylase
MADRLDVAVIGAGPFGLSVAAHLAHRTVRTFGEPMQTWRSRMPPDMLLRSAWGETSLSDPGARGTIDGWAAESGERREEPIPLEKFLRYSDWFRRKFVPESDPADVVALDRAGSWYRLTTAAGDEVESRSVVLAVGVAPFSHAPAPFSDAIADNVRFAFDQHEFARYRNRRVIVVGGGQGGLESAGLAARAGADVELIVRSRLHWFADREPMNPRGPVGRRLYRLAYPAVGYGPPPLNRLALHPDLFAALPRRLRRRLTRRLLRPGGSPWLRPLIEGKVRVTEETTVRTLHRSGGHLRLGLSRGPAREAEVVLVAAGFRFSLDRLGFLSTRLRREIAVQDGWPVLDRFFRSTVPTLLFVGYAAEDRFGPLSRFVLGTPFTAARVRRALDA